METATTTDTISPASYNTNDNAADAETGNVIDAYISPKTREKYIVRLTNFVTWVFDNSPKYDFLLHDDFIEEMKLHHSQDKNHVTKNGTPSKMRTNLRTFVKESIRAIKDEKEETHFLHLQHLNFTIYTRYLSTFKKLLSSSSKKRRSEGDTVGKVGDVMIRLSSSTYEGECSALSFLFRKIGMIKTHDLFDKLSRYKKGSRRFRAKEKKTMVCS